jgi:hypothetical protein
MTESIELWQGSDKMRNYYCTEDHVSVEDIAKMRMKYFDRRKFIYDESRLIKRDTHFPGSDDATIPRGSIEAVRATADMFQLQRGPRPRTSVLCSHEDPLVVRRQSLQKTREKRDAAAKLVQEAKDAKTLARLKATEMRKEDQLNKAATNAAAAKAAAAKVAAVKAAAAKVAAAKVATAKAAAAKRKKPPSTPKTPAAKKSMISAPIQNLNPVREQPAMVTQQCMYDSNMPSCV